MMQLPGIMVISILGTGMSTLFFLIALKMIGTVRTVLLYSTTAMFGVIFSGIFLGETITIRHCFIGVSTRRNILASE